MLGKSRAALADRSVAERSYSVEILVASFAGLLLEIAYTRVISFKLFYYYTYFVIGLSLLGIGTGGALVAISRRLRRADTDTIVMWSMLLAAASIGVGYVVVARTSIDTLAIWEYGTRASFGSIARLVLICLAIFASFVSIGVLIATLFARKPENIGGLYFADLVGAGIACLIAVTLLGSIGPPATIFLSGLFLAGGGLRIAVRRNSRGISLGAAAVAVLLAVGVVAPSLIPQQRLDLTKVQIDDSTTLVSRWNPIFRIDVIQPSAGVRLLLHDGIIGSAIYRYRGSGSDLSRFDEDPRLFPFATAGAAPKNVLIIGAAGGNEILASLHFDAQHIDAVELNPVTYDLVTDDFADFDGHLAEDPRVNYVKGDGRSYLARSDRSYDLVWYPAPDSYAAANAASAGAFVLSESYLYTSEAIVDSVEHLGPDGILATQYGEYNYDEKPNRTTRYAATARHALAELGVKDPSRHILVATTPRDVGSTLSTLLVKRTPFTQSEVDRFVESLEDVPGSVLTYAPDHQGRSDAVSRVITASSRELDSFYDSYQYNVRPITDDGPFFWHFAEFDKVIGDFGNSIDRNDPEDAVGERVLLLLVGIATVLAALFLLLPFMRIRDIWRKLPRKSSSAVYFSALGFGFIFFEVTLIQRLTLFLGFPTYSLTVTLMAILLSTGVGALLSARYRDQANRLLPILLSTLAGLTVFYAFALPPITDALLGTPLALRFVVAFVVLAPLGLCLGMMMPLGLGAVAGLTEHAQEYVAWAWAVNGFASVIGAALTTILAMTFGFEVVLFVALALYVMAFTILRSMLRAVPAPSA